MGQTFCSSMGHAGGIQTPQSWSDLFTIIQVEFKLPNLFWVKAYNLIMKERDTHATITFSIPHKCPMHAQPHCSNSQPEDHIIIEPNVDSTPTRQSIHQPSFASTYVVHLKRKLSKASLVLPPFLFTYRRLVHF
jgi:hypothetical protein